MKTKPRKVTELGWVSRPDLGLYVWQRPDGSLYTHKADVEPEIDVPDIEGTIAADHAEATRTDDARRQERLSGLRCACCDAPLPAGWSGDECAECADIAP